MSKPAKLKDKLHHLRTRRNLSVQQVAAHVGCAMSTYREWEQGRAIRGEPYLKLCEIFEVSLDELLGGNTTPQFREIETGFQDVEMAVSKLKKTWMQSKKT